MLPRKCYGQSLVAMGGGQLSGDGYVFDSNMLFKRSRPAAASGGGGFHNAY